LNNFFEGYLAFFHFSGFGLFETTYGQIWPFEFFLDLTTLNQIIVIFSSSQEGEGLREQARPEMPVLRKVFFRIKQILQTRKHLSSRCQFHQHFTYEFFVRTSFFYIHVSRKSCQNVMFVPKICTFNVDEIDGR